MAATRAQHFRTDERGAVAILFGLMIMVCCMSAGLAIDYARILMARNTLLDAADAAGLATARAMVDGKLTTTEAQAIGQAYFAENAKGLSKTHTPVPVPTITADASAKTVTVTAQATVQMTLMAVAGFKTVNVPTSSTVAFDGKDLEVGMALDITGSMNDVPPGGGPRKIDGLKTAFKSFAETLIPAPPQIGRKIRIGVQPFSASVNLGKYAAAASNSRSKDGCVTERKTPSYSDNTPTVGGYFQVSADGTANIDPTEGGVGDNRYFCPAPAVMPLSDNRDALVARVNTFNAGGYTAGHLGVQWGWNLIAEDYASFWGASSAPAPYADTQGPKPKLIKAMILMTDGIFNTAYHPDIARKQALAMCANMKAKGIRVFTIGFGLGNTGSEIEAKKTLAACASDPTYFVDASNTADLDAALQSFATVLNKLRIAS